MAASRSSFTLRFSDPRNRSLLQVVARRQGVSMNTLAEQLLERELRHEAAILRNELEVSLRMLARYEPNSDARNDVAEFARAEVTVDDPLRATKVELVDVDPFATVEALADAVE